MTRRWSLRTRFVAAASLCLLPLLGVVFYILGQSLDNSRAQVYDTQFAFAEVVSRGITQTLTENQEVLANLATNSKIRSMDPVTSQEVLGQAKELRPSLTGLFLLDPDQKLIAYSGGIDPVLFAEQIQTAADLSLTAGESAITNKIDVADSDVSVIAMISPVLAEADNTDEGGVPVGAIGSFLSVDRLQRSFLPVTGEAESRTTVALLTDTGVIADQGTPGDETADLVDSLQPEIAESVSGKRLRISYEDALGEERQGVLLPIEYPGAKWAVAVTGPSPRTYAPNQSLIRNGIIALTTAVLLTLLMAVLFGELFSRPLRRLRDQVASIAAGNFDQQVTVIGTGEVASLSKSVGDMASLLAVEAHDADEARAETASRTELMRELLRRTIRLQEDERRRIAADIHDAVSPLITGALYQMRALIMRENGKNGNGFAEQDDGNSFTMSDGLTEATGLLEQSMDELHNVIFALRPPDLDDVGVVAAVERYVHQINRTGLPTELEVIGDQRRLSPEIRLGVYRIIQESLHNALRHAHADEALVKLEFLDDGLRVSVRDNGSGFDTESAMRFGSLGLMSMRERAAAIGADLEIISRPGAGTITLLTRPWERDLVNVPLDYTESETDDDVVEPGSSNPIPLEPTNGSVTVRESSEVASP